MLTQHNVHAVSPCSIKRETSIIPGYRLYHSCQERGRGYCPFFHTCSRLFYYLCARLHTPQCRSCSDGNPSHPWMPVSAGMATGHARSYLVAPVQRDLCVTSAAARLNVILSAAKNPKGFITRQRTFASKGFGFFTSLRSVQNDSKSASADIPRGVTQRSLQTGACCSPSLYNNNRTSCRGRTPPPYHPWMPVYTGMTDWTRLMTSFPPTSENPGAQAAILTRSAGQGAVQGRAIPACARRALARS